MNVKAKKKKKKKKGRAGSAMFTQNCVYIPVSLDTLLLYRVCLFISQLFIQISLPFYCSHLPGAVLDYQPGNMHGLLAKESTATTKMKK